MDDLAKNPACPQLGGNGCQPGACARRLFLQGFGMAIPGVFGSPATIARDIAGYSPD